MRHMASLFAGVLLCCAAAHAQSASPQPPPQEDHSHHQPAAPHESQPNDAWPVSEEERRAAFPDVHGHPAHDNAIQSLVLVDQLEWLPASRGHAVSWDTSGWVGRDLDRVWFRSEGERAAAGFEHAEAQLLYGRAIGRWWDVVAGVRQDVRPGPGRTWAAVGLQGLAPYWFELQATLYIGAGGRTFARLETEYEFLLSNRLVLQPLLEIDVYGTRDDARGIGAGVSSADAGLRLRYEFRREFAPYVGITWDRRFFGTADAARAAGETVGGARLAVGVRLWR